MSLTWHRVPHKSVFSTAVASSAGGTPAVSRSISFQANSNRKRRQAEVAGDSATEVRTGNPTRAVVSSSSLRLAQRRLTTGFSESETLTMRMPSLSLRGSCSATCFRLLAVMPLLGNKSKSVALPDAALNCDEKYDVRFCGSRPKRSDGACVSHSYWPLKSWPCRSSLTIGPLLASYFHTFSSRVPYRTTPRSSRKFFKFTSRICRVHCPEWRLPHGQMSAMLPILRE